MSETPLRILVVVAHPHDFTHCSATCGIHAARGDSVTLVTVTSGAQTHNERLHDELIKPEAERDPAVMNQSEADYSEQKAREIRQVCALFGVEDVRLLNCPDKPFRKTPEAVEILRDIIYELRPHVLITQSPFLQGRHGMATGTHDDHKDTAFAIQEAQMLASLPNYETLKRPHTIAATYYPGVYFMPDEIDFYVDISAWKEQRVEAESLFSSQGHTKAFAQKRIEISAGHMGWYSGVEYAEGFVRAAPELLPEIQVPEAALRRAGEPRANHLKRIAGELEE
jgi:LmbE family N-acetylglucosaminyl deacetylase